MKLILQSVILEDLIFKSLGLLRIERQWQANFLIHITSEDQTFGSDEVYFIVVSNNFKFDKNNADFKADLKQDSLDILPVMKEISKRLASFSPTNEDDFYKSLNKYFTNNEDEV